MALNHEVWRRLQHGVIYALYMRCLDGIALENPTGAFHLRVLEQAREIFVVRRVQLALFVDRFRNSHPSIFTVKIGVVENFCDRILREVAAKRVIGKVVTTVIDM